MRPDVLGGIAGIVVLSWYVLWRIAVFRDLFGRMRRILHRDSKA